MKFSHVRGILASHIVLNKSRALFYFYISVQIDSLIISINRLFCAYCSFACVFCIYHSRVALVCWGRGGIKCSWHVGAS